MAETWPPLRWWRWARLHVRGRERAVAALVASALVVTGVTAFVAGSRSDDEQDLSAARNQIRSLEQRQRHDVVKADVADLDFRAFELVAPIGIRTDGDQAVVTFSSRLDVSAGRKHVRHEAWHTEVWERSHDRWQLVWSQTTAIGGFPPPAVGT